MRIFRILFLALNFCVAIALLFSYSTNFISPQTLWITEGFALAYRLTLLANAAFALFWLFTKKKKYALISFAILLLGFNGIKELYSISKKDFTVSHENNIRLVSYNVRYFFKNGGWRKSAENQTEIFKFLQKTKPDVICFQEYHHDNKWKYVMADTLKKQLGLEFMESYKQHKINGRYFSGLATFSKYPIVNSGVMEYQNTGNGSVWVDIVKNQDTIRIYNNHLESYRFAHDNIKVMEDVQNTQMVDEKDVRVIISKVKKALGLRTQQANELSDHISKSPYSVVVCGDFNSPAHSYVYKQIVKRNNLHDAFLNSGEKIGGTLVWNLPDIRLDYILHSNSLESGNFTVEKILSSDHYPIYCDIKLR